MDITSISAAIASTDTLINIAKTIFDIAKQSDLRKNISELQSELITLQSRLLSAQQEQSQLIQIKNEIEKKLIEYENWENTKSNYKLIEITTGIFVYSLKKNKKSTEPAHWLCCKCFDIDHKKSLLQYYDITPNGKDIKYICPACKNMIRIPKDTRP